MSRARFKLLSVTVLSFLLLASAGFAQGDTTLRMTWWGSQNRHDRTIRAIEMFEAQNPNINIEYEFSGWGDYWTRLNTQAAGGRLACIIQQDYAYLGEWTSRNLLIPLDPFFESGVIDTTHISQSLLDGGRVRGTTYGISLGTNSQAFMIDLDMLEEAGMELPANDWTWADFEAYALELHEQLGIWALGSSLPDEALWKSLFLGHETWAFNDDGTALGYESDEPLIDYFNMIMRLQDAGAVPNQQQAAEFTGAPESAPIVTRRAAMDYRWSNQAVAVWSASGADRRFALVPLPRPVGGVSQNYLKPSMFFSISSQCPNPEEAAQFINFFVNDLEVNEILFAERGVPTPTTVWEHLRPQLEVAPAETFNFLALVAEDARPVPPADPAGWGDVLNNVYHPIFVEPVLYRQIPVARGAAMLREEANDILARNRR